MTARGGRDSIDHAPGAHDDLANAVAGTCVLAAGDREPGLLVYMRREFERIQAERAKAAALQPGGFATHEIGGDCSAAERERRLQAYERLEREARMRGRHY